MNISLKKTYRFKTMFITIRHQEMKIKNHNEIPLYITVAKIETVIT
jgi:hypothetical protein